MSFDRERSPEPVEKDDPSYVRVYQTHPGENWIAFDEKCPDRKASGATKSLARQAFKNMFGY